MFHPHKSGKVSTADLMVIDGLKHFETLDLQGSKTLFTKAIQIDCNNGPAYLNRGVLYEQCGNYKAAISDFINACRLLPRNPLAFYNKGIACVRLNRDDEAYKDVCQAIELDGENYSQFYTCRAHILRRQGKYSDATLDYLKLNVLSSYGGNIGGNKQPSYAPTRRGSLEGGYIEPPTNYNSYEEIFDAKTITSRSKETQKALETPPNLRTKEQVELLLRVSDDLQTFFKRFSKSEIISMWQ